MLLIRIYFCNIYKIKYYKNCTSADGKFNGIQYSLESSIKARDLGIIRTSQYDQTVCNPDLSWIPYKAFLLFLLQKRSRR